MGVGAVWGRSVGPCIHGLMLSKMRASPFSVALKALRALGTCAEADVTG